MIIPYSTALSKEKNLRICPVCGSVAHLHGKRDRGFIWNGRRRVIQLQRTQCQNKNCRSVHTWLPAILSALKRYANRELEQFLSLWPEVKARSQIRTQADERTQRRWYKEYREKLHRWASELMSIYVTATNRLQSLTTIEKSSVGYLRQVLVLFPKFRRNRGFLGSSQIILFPHHHRPAWLAMATI